MTAKVTIYLDCNNGEVPKPKNQAQDDFFDRCLKISDLDDKILVGRSSSDRNPDPDTSNAIFNSRVISRQHAEINVDQYGQVYITDLNSTHGTYVNNKKLEADMPMRLKEKDSITFGTNVSHGTRGYFEARTFKVDYRWNDMMTEDQEQKQQPVSGSFKVPDNSSDEGDSEPEVLSVIRLNKKGPTAQPKSTVTKTSVIELFSDDESISDTPVVITSTTYTPTKIMTADAEADLYNEDDEEFAPFSPVQEHTFVAEPQTPEGLTAVNPSSQTTAEATLPTPPASDGKMKIDHIIAPEDADAPQLAHFKVTANSTHDNAQLGDSFEEERFNKHHHVHEESSIQEDILGATRQKSVFRPSPFIRAMEQDIGLYDPDIRTPYPSGSDDTTMETSSVMAEAGNSTSAKTITLEDVNPTRPYSHATPGTGSRAKDFQDSLHALRDSYGPVGGVLPSFATPWKLPPMVYPDTFAHLGMPSNTTTESWLPEDNLSTLAEPNQSQVIAGPSPRSGISISSIVDMHQQPSHQDLMRQFADIRASEEEPVATQPSFDDMHFMSDVPDLITADPIKKSVSPAVDATNDCVSEYGMTDSTTIEAELEPLPSLNPESSRKRKAATDDIEQTHDAIGAERSDKRLRSDLKRLRAQLTKDAIEHTAAEVVPPQPDAPKNVEPGWGPSIRAFMFGTVVGGAMMFGGLLNMAD